MVCVYAHQDVEQITFLKKKGQCTFPIIAMLFKKKVQLEECLKTNYAAFMLSEEQFAVNHHS